MNESSCCSTSSPAFGVVIVPDFGHSNRYIVKSHCCFNLQYPDDMWREVSLHMLICQLYIFSLVRCLFRSLAHFFFLINLLSFKSFLCILDTSSSWDLSFASINIFLICGLSSHSLQPWLLCWWFQPLTEARYGVRFSHFQPIQDSSRGQSLLQALRRLAETLSDLYYGQLALPCPAHSGVLSIPF